MNPLIFCPSPRDIKEFSEATTKLNFDKLWVKYYPQQEAYDMARNWFLEKEQYTHLIILPDDLIVTQQQIESLLSHNRDIVSGFCNMHENNVYSNVSNDEVCVKEYDFGFGPKQFFTGFKFSYLEELRKKGYKLLQVRFSGFGPACLHRPVVEKIPFRTYNGTNVDALFAREIWRTYKQYVDLSVRTKHLDEYNLQVGKKTAFVALEQNGITTDVYTTTPILGVT